MTNDADLQPAVAAEFQALAGLLDSATDAQWDTPSLCAGCTRPRASISGAS